MINCESGWKLQAKIIIKGIPFGSLRNVRLVIKEQDRKKYYPGKHYLVS